MAETRNLVAVDLGAESGRLALCSWDGSRGTLREIHRFPNRPHQQDGHLVWDLEYIWKEILTGLRIAAAATSGGIDSVAVDGWGVDYVCLDRDGNRIGHAYCYRDPRNILAMERAFTILPRKRIYEITGIQFMPLNTLYQILAHKSEFPAEWDRTAIWLNLHEYFQYRLSAVATDEYTNASTTQMLDVFARTWSRELATAFDLDLEKFPPIAQPGTVLGNLRPEIAREVGLNNTQIIAPACHDTACAVAGIPFPHDRLAFISSGTWSLVGTVLNNPVVSAQALEHNFTNEGGVGKTIRFLRNVIGMWLLQECLREWNAQGLSLTAAQLAQDCTGIPPEGPYFPIEEKEFLAPGNMVARINAALERQGFAPETQPVGVAAAIFRSLARSYAEVIKDLCQTTGKTFDRVCIVGGGVRNQTLNTLTGQLTGLEVVKGSSESSAIGNVALQIAAVENTRSLEQIQAISARLTFQVAS